MIAATGGELIGTLAALFALGTRTVIAAVVPVLDEETAAVMVALHGRLNAGQTPAEALAGTLGDLRPDDPATWTAASFVCFGAA
jgi:CHAT domain-containing protein